MLEVKVTTLPAHVLNNRNNLHHLQVDFRCCASAALWKPDGDAAAAVCQSPAHSPVSGFHARVNTAAKQQLSRIFSHRESYGCTLRMAFCFSALINVSFPFVLFGLVGGSCLEAFPTSQQDNAAVLPEVVPRWNRLLITQEEGESLTLKLNLWLDSHRQIHVVVHSCLPAGTHTAAHLCASSCSPLCTVCRCCEWNPPLQLS